MSAWREWLVRLVPQGVKDLARAEVGRAMDARANAPDVVELAARVAQLESVLHHEMGMHLLPPRHLQVRVVGGYSSSFIESGHTACAAMDDILGAVSMRLNGFGSILDFGCGCGRIIRAVRTWAPEARLSGTDIDAEAIGWLKENAARVASFDTNPHRPPMRYEDDSFDFIYSISIFTHLPEDMQFEWLEELRRIARRGAYLLLTTHGAKHHSSLPAAAREELNKTGFHYTPVDTVTTEGLPVFYQSTYHTLDYIRREWARYFEIVEVRELGMHDHQDTILLRNVRG